MPEDHPQPGTAAFGPVAGPGHDAPTPPPSVGHTAGTDGLLTTLPARLGRYVVLNLLGKGGMGAVYLADDTHLNRRVAFKVPHLAGADPDTVRSLRDRFLREARLAASLTHPNLCTVYDCGEIDGLLYMAMAYVEGKPLAKFIRPGQPLPPRAVVAVVRQLALAMQEAHSRGIIHRDLKPANIMVTPTRQPVIMDFGVARRTDAEDTRLTRTGLVVGTPAYLPPEQLNCDQALIGPATDIYALGVILYELLAGRTPFQGPFGALMAQIMVDPPPPLAKWRPDLDPALGGICVRALAKPPQDRFPSMMAFANALDEYLHAPVRPASATLPPAPPLRPAAAHPVHPAGPLDEENAATLFNEMAAQQVRLGGAPRLHEATRRRRPRRRRRFHLLEWLIPLAGSLAALAVAVVVLGLLFNYLSNRRTSITQSAPGTAGSESPNDPPPPGWDETPKEFRTAFERLRRDWGANTDSLKVIRQWAGDPDLLKTVPDGPALEVGKHLAFEGDWIHAAPLIRRSGVRRWVDALDKDEAARGTATGAEKYGAAEAWWNLAAGEGEFAERIRQRARKWYREAAPGLPTGAEHTRAIERGNVGP